MRLIIRLSMLFLQKDGEITRDGSEQHSKK